MNFERDTMLTPLCCSFGSQRNDLIAIDMNKAYTSNLMEMDHFPSFNDIVFGTLQKYDDRELENYTMYYVKALEENHETAIFFDNKYSRLSIQAQEGPHELFQDTVSQEAQQPDQKKCQGEDQAAL